jgi:tRNA dimethylallyltransferase
MRRPIKHKIIIILGPTASGKSDLGVEIALRLARGKPQVGGEIISADSRQVYRGMDIGTGKITRKEMRGIPHHLLDVASPRSDFNVSHFKKLAEKKIKEIIARDNVPIIVGGTGFWIDALIYDFNLPEIRPDKKLRAKLEKIPVEKLFEKLRKLDPERAKNIDSKNPRRLIRALEIVLLSKCQIPKLKRESKYDTLFIGIKKDKVELEKKIYKRLIKRLDDGMIEEVKKLHNPPIGGGVSWKRLDSFGLEYRYISRYLCGLLSRDEMIVQLFSAIKKYAKRQMVWFKRNKKIKWTSGDSEAINFTRDFLKTK